MTRKPLSAVATTRHHRAKADTRSPAAGQEDLVLAHATASPPQDHSGTTTVQLTGRAILWRPRHGDGARNLVHTPFLFWLIETLHPLRVVQIGLEDSSGYLTLCQALDKLGSEGLALGIEADPAAPAMTPTIAAQHDLLYGDFSTLTDASVDRAALQLRDSPVDLMVIDTALTPEFLSLLRAHWLPRLSERSVLLVLRPELNMATPEARQFLEDMRRGRPSLSFNQGKPGLEVLLVGADQPAPLLRLAALEPGMPDYLRARQVFARLGEGLENGQLAESRQAALSKSEVSAEELTVQLTALQATLDGERAAKEAAQNGEAAQVALVGGLQAQIFDLQLAQEQALRNLAEQTHLKAELEKAESARIALVETVKAGVTERAALQAELDKLRTLQAERTAMQAELVKLRNAYAERTALQAELEKLRVSTAERTSVAERNAQEQREEMLRIRAGLEAETKRMQDALTAAETARQDALDRAAHLAKALDQQRAAQAEDQARVAMLEAERDSAKDRLETANKELVILTRIAEDHRHEAATAHTKDRARITKLESDRESLRAARDTARHELVVVTRIAEDLRHQAAAARAEVAALRSSSSWRITAPIRSALDRGRGR